MVFAKIYKCLTSIGFFIRKFEEFVYIMFGKSCQAWPQVSKSIEKIWFEPRRRYDQKFYWPSQKRSFTLKTATNCNHTRQNNTKNDNQCAKHRQCDQREKHDATRKSTTMEYTNKSLDSYNIIQKLGLIHIIWINSDTNVNLQEFFNVVYWCRNSYK